MGVAPSGYIMVKSLVETMMNFADKAAGGDLLSEEWKTMTKEQVERVRGGGPCALAPV